MEEEKAKLKLLDKCVEWYTQGCRRDQEQIERLKRNHPLLMGIVLGLFPSIPAYVNFIVLWAFFGVMVSNKEPLIVLISVLGTLYCLNEWFHQVNERRKK